MNKILHILIFALQISCVFHLKAQSPKREMRATWLATVFRIDWPGSTIAGTGNATQINSQKQDMIRILDSLASANMNAVFFQVRSRCDAMYKSSYEPWSTDLVQYRGLDPGYDPLAFAIEEAHKRGLELHAWLNPYRYETVLNQWTGMAGDYRTEHPDWILSYSNGISILDPGRPQVVKRIKDIIGEIVTNYNVDGIMFDDYFYAYGGTSITLDATTQALYKPANMDLGDWRRANVNHMIAEVYDTIQDIKPFVRFGVSPFGIWTTNQAVAAKQDIILPTGITGSDMYAQIYCDPVAWLKEKSVDYISPQLYWGTGGSQDYSKLCPWWSDLSNRFGRHFYSSQDIAGLQTSNYAPKQRIIADNFEHKYEELISNESATSSVEKVILSKIVNVPAGNFSQEQIGLQISINRSSDKNNAPGSVFFSTKQLYQTKGFINYLKKYQFTHEALTPAVVWKNKTELTMVSDIAISGNKLSWTSAGANRKYAVYIIPNTKLPSEIKFNTSEFLAGTVFTNSFTLSGGISATSFKFGVSVLDMYGNESSVKIMGQPTLQIQPPSLIYPANNQSIILPFSLEWSQVENAESYVLEIAEDELFSKILTSRELNATTFSTTFLNFLSPDVVCYWRVRAKAINANDAISEVRKFTPVEFKVTNPLTGSIGISLTPTITWHNIGTNKSYLVEIATNGQFTSNSIIYSANVSTDNALIPEKKLIGLTNYFVRVSTVINSINTISKVVSFTTKEQIPEVPQIILPIDNATLFGTAIKIKWIEDVASSYRIELSKENTFPVRSTTVKTAIAFANEVTFDALTPGDYFFRIRADYSNTLFTAWSSTSKVILKETTSMDALKNENIKVFSTKGKITIQQNDNLNKTLNFKLITTNGVEIPLNTKIYDANSKSFDIDIQHIPSGIYILQMSNENSSINFKVFR